MSVKRTLAAGALGLTIALGATGYAMANQDSRPTEANDFAVEVSNEALERAYDGIGRKVWKECGEGHERCDAVLKEINGLGLNWGGDDYRVTWFEDGSWSIED
ncbi:hypothetical protein [Streptomyces narbonensis]|uniref:hypothetical protein n=1 Tax=Streptomyces narbonensis TaxID=67333 RepID=UPI0033E0412F